MDLKQLYKTNEEFKKYVDRMAQTKHRCVDVVLEWEVVKQTAQYYVERGRVVRIDEVSED